MPPKKKTTKVKNTKKKVKKTKKKVENIIEDTEEPDSIMDNSDDEEDMNEEVVQDSGSDSDNFDEDNNEEENDEEEIDEENDDEENDDEIDLTDEAEKIFLEDYNLLLKKEDFTSEDKLNNLKLSIYEITRIIGTRATQIARGAKPFLKKSENMSPIDIAKEELKNKLVPIKLIRPMPNGTEEVWSLNEFKE